uniref:Uncharacterized protein n=1 Tax=Romanomermis culicivorax TaxID=13658 RepID=A0A915IEB6_ROMCU
MESPKQKWIEGALYAMNPAAALAIQLEKKLLEEINDNTSTNKKRLSR